MQPQNPYTTGRDPQPIQQGGLPPVVPPPAGAPAPLHGDASLEQSAPAPSNGSSVEQWVGEVERVMADTTHNPRMRAEAFAELKLRYQQSQAIGREGGAQ